MLTSAASRFEEIPQAHPSNFRISGALAQIHARVGNLEETEKLMAHARVSFGGTLEPVAFLLKSGRAETARQALQNILSRGTNLTYTLTGSWGGTSPIWVEPVSELKKEGFIDEQVALDSTYRARY